MADGKQLHDSNKSKRASFPLTAFEQYLLAEDRPDNPCWIIVKFHFSGVFKKNELQLAYEKALERNPLLRAVLKRSLTGSLRWDVLKEWKPLLRWLKGPLEKEWPMWEPFDLFSQPGFRLYVVEQDDKTEWIFHFHHAICDGKALRDIFYDILNHYAIALGQPVPLRELREEIFAQRNRLANTWRERLKTLPSQLLGLWITQRFQKRQIAPLHQKAVDKTDPQHPSSYPALVSRRLSQECFRKVRDEALRQKVTTNDIFLRDLYHTIKLWREWKQEGDPMDWIRIVLPVDMRKPVDRFLSAANVTSIVTLDRRMRALNNRKRLLELVHEDMNWVKHRGLRFTFWTLLRLRKLLPNGIERHSHRPACQGTIIFANHCQLITRSSLINREKKIEVPGAIMEDIIMVSPIRAGTVAALVVGTYANRLLIDLHYDPESLSKSQAEKLVDTFIAQLDAYEAKDDRN